MVLLAAGMLIFWPWQPHHYANSPDVAIPSLARAVKLASVATFAAMKTSLNGEMHRLHKAIVGVIVLLTSPLSRNCTKHKIRCPYNDVQVTPEPERSATPDKADLMWTPQIEAEIAEWQRTGVFPFPSLGVYPAPMPHLYSLEDLRLIYHLAALYHQLATIDANNFTLWTRHIPTYVPSFVSQHTGLLLTTVSL